jgi:hypothetical protein
MSTRVVVIVGVLWFGSLLAVAGAREQQSPQVVPIPSNGKVLSGGDIGFRVESVQGNVPVGSFVILWNGKWVEPRSSTKPMRISPTR